MRNEIFKMVGQFYTSKYLLIITLVFISSISVIAQNDCCKQENIGKNIVKNLKSKFGIILPNSVQSKQKYKLKESGVTYLLIKMSKDEALEFISATKNSTGPKGLLTEIQDKECRQRGDCIAIGSVFSPSDEPEEVDQWQKDNDFKSDTVATFTFTKNGRLERFASFFLDTEKGLLMLWYKK